MAEDPAPFIYAPDPDHPGWMRWEMRDQTRYNAFLGPLLIKGEGGKAYARMLPERQHSNFSNAVHGGTLMGFIDISLFAGARIFGMLDPGPAVTLDLSFHFIAAGRTGEPLNAEMELLKETGRLMFLRGLATQGEDIIASFSGTIRKPSKK